MRFFEIKQPLNEASLKGTSTASWPAYLANMLTAPGISIGATGDKVQGLQLTPKSKKLIQQMINSFESSPDDKAFQKELAKEVEESELTFTDGSSYPIKQIYKSPEIKAGGSGSSGSSTGVATKKYWNEGEVAETLLGAALYARFMSMDSITEQDVISVMKKKFKADASGFTAKGVRNNNPVLMTAVNKEQNNQVITAYISDTAAFTEKFPEGVKGITKSLKACVAYVNESVKVAEAIAEADNNPEADSILIKTDGVTEQKGTKADLQLSVGKLQRLLSLKVNAVKQFGQNTGSTNSVISTFFNRFIPEANIASLEAEWPDMNGVKATNALKAAGKFEDAVKKVYALTGRAYQIAKQALDSKLKANPAGVITDIYEGIMHHAQLGANSGQTLVILNPGGKKTWQELEFGEGLNQAIGSFRLEASVGVAGMNGENNHILRVFGRPADSKAAVAMATTINTPKDAQQALKKAPQATDPELLFQLRSYNQENGTQRNIVEMGPLLKDITEVQKINDVAGQDIAPEAVKHAVPHATKAKVAKPATAPNDAVAKTSTPAELPTTANTPSPDLQGPNVTTLQPGNDATQANKWVHPRPQDIDDLQRLAGLVKHQ